MPGRGRPIQGPQGETGRPGIPGIYGDSGLPGFDGIPGIKGKRGDDCGVCSPGNYVISIRTNNVQGHQ